MQPDTGVKDDDFYVVLSAMPFQSLIGPCRVCGVELQCEPMEDEASIGFMPVFGRYEDAQKFVDSMAVKGAEIMHVERVT